MLPLNLKRKQSSRIVCSMHRRIFLLRSYFKDQNGAAEIVAHQT